MKRADESSVFLKQRVVYGKYFKISNTLLFQFLSKRLIIKTGSGKLFARLANREDPDQTASSEAV